MTKAKAEKRAAPTGTVIKGLITQCHAEETALTRPPTPRGHHDKETIRRSREGILIKDKGEENKKEEDDRDTKGKTKTAASISSSPQRNRPRKRRI